MAATKIPSAPRQPPFTTKISSHLGSSKINKPVTRSTRSKASSNKIAQSQLDSTNNSAIRIPLLRAKLVVACQNYVTDDVLFDAVTTGFTSGVERWITPATLKASLGGRKKRYFVVDAKTWNFEEHGSAYECRLHTQSLPIDAGNGVVLFVKELPEWTAFMAGYKQQSKRGSGHLLRAGYQQVERQWKDEWRKQCGVESGWRDKNAGPMWVLVKSAVRSLAISETRDA